MQLLFWVSLLGACYSYVVYPLILLLLPRRRNQALFASCNLPYITIIITAHNEETRIEEKLKNTLATDYPEAQREIIVASDASSDQTDNIVRTFRDRGVQLARSDERKGKEYAQLMAIEESKGEILIFTDAGTRISRGGITLMVERFNDRRVGAVSSDDRVISKDSAIASEGLYVRYEMWLRALESKVNTLVGLSGSFFAARRDVCEPWDIHSPSDFQTALNCQRLGYVAVSDSRVIGYYPEVGDEQKDYHRKVRTILRGITWVFREPAVLNPIKFRMFAFQMWSHKLFRWFAPWFLVLLCVSSLVLAGHDDFYLGMGILQSLFYALAIGGFLSKSLRAIPLFKIPFFFVQSNVAIVHATVAFIAGKRMSTWEPSAR